MLVTRTAPALVVPPALERLVDHAYNLWWSWHAEARGLYLELDPMLWEAVNGNPVLMLHRLAPETLERAAQDETYLRRLRDVAARFDAEIHAPAEQTWIGRRRPFLMDKTIAYFSAEFGLNSTLPIYSGGPRRPG